KRDPHLIQKLVAESSGILNWALEGCAAWRTDGLGTAAAITSATQEYRESEDQVGRFIDERCSIAPDRYAPCTAVHTAYVEWSDSQGEQPLKARDFRSALDKRGHPISTQRVGGAPTKVRMGLVLRTHAEWEVPA